MEEEMKEVKQQKAKLESSAKGQGDRITQLKVDRAYVYTHKIYSLTLAYSCLTVSWNKMLNVSMMR